MMECMEPRQALHSNSRSENLKNDEIKNEFRIKNDKPDHIKGIPPYLENFQMIAKGLELRAFYDAPTKQTTYTYTVLWEDYNKPKDTQTKSIKSLTENSTSTSKTFSDLTVSKFSNSIYPVLALCDGPCKKKIPSNKLNTIGRCGHYLCDACYGIVINSDGSKGCSSLNCNWNGSTKEEAILAYEKQIVRKQRERAKQMKSRGLDVKVASSLSGLTLTSKSEEAPNRSDFYGQNPTIFNDNCDSKTDASSKEGSIIIENYPESTKKKLVRQNIYPGRNEMSIVKLVLIEKSPFNATLRIHHQMETMTSVRLNRVLSSMLLDNKRNPIQILGNALLYYVKNDSDGTKKLKRVDHETMCSAFLYNFPQINNYLYFILDTMGYVKKKPVRLFLNFDD